LVVEKMKVPYTMKTIPLKSYMKPGDSAKREEYMKLCPDGFVPAVQMAARSTDGSTEFGPALESGRKPGLNAGYEICVDLMQRLPQEFPLPRTPLRRGYGEALMKRAADFEEIAYAVMNEKPGSEGPFMAFMDELSEVLMGHPMEGKVAGRFAWWNWGVDDGDGDEEAFGGDKQAGPFMFGKHPCAADLLLLPMLERVEAYLPPDASSPLSLEKWLAVKQMLEAARAPGACAFHDIGADSETLRSIRARHRGSAAVRSAQAASTTQLAADAASDHEAGRDAAARVVKKHHAIARFATMGAGAFRPSPAEVSDSVVAATEDALQLVADSLLSGTQEPAAAVSAAAEAASTLASAQAADVLSETAAALLFLADNTGVPRDMGADAAKVFRAHLRLLALALQALQNPE